ncbi:MAG: nucleotidyltransferase domain-containing protein [Clostridiales bacterium]|nr:nucleotidyltransferase domain-containing protein [Clostridiales bacterium]
MTIPEILDNIISICKNHDADIVILFGSRAKGTATKYSDIDIAVKGAMDFDDLEEEIEEIPTLYTIDVVNVDDCRNDLLLEDIDLYGRKIYEKI